MWTALVSLDLVHRRLYLVGRRGGAAHARRVRGDATGAGARTAHLGGRRRLPRPRRTNSAARSPPSPSIAKELVRECRRTAPMPRTRSCCSSQSERCRDDPRRAGAAARRGRRRTLRARCLSRRWSRRPGEPHRAAPASAIRLSIPCPATNRRAARTATRPLGRAPRPGDHARARQPHPERGRNSRGSEVTRHDELGARTRSRSTSSMTARASRSRFWRASANPISRARAGDGRAHGARHLHRAKPARAHRAPGSISPICRRRRARS